MSEALQPAHSAALGDQEATGLSWLPTWKSAYIFVVCSFVLWLALLIALTELSA